MGPLGPRLPASVSGPRSRERGEYFADLLSARVAGRGPTATALAKVRLGQAIDHVLRATSDTRWPNRNVWQGVRSAIEGLPKSQVERARIAEVGEVPALIDTHPPIALRIELVEALGPIDGSMKITAEDHQQFESSVRAHSSRVGAEIVDEYRSSLYA